MPIIKPYKILNSIFDIELSELKKQGYKYCFIDLDNTFACYFEKKPSEYSYKILDLFRKYEIELIIISNNTEKRVSEFANVLNLKYFASFKKPLPFNYNKAIKKLNISKNEVFAIGDQLLTDVVGANLVKLKSFYVKPLINNDKWVTVLNRKIERLIFKIYGKKM